MPNTPLISVIIPSFNREELISQTLQSIIGQTYENWECLVVDDGSTDNTVEVIKNFEKKDSRIYSIERPFTALKGAPVCRNIGIGRAKGKYIIFLDSDDILDQTCLQGRVYQMEQSAVDFMVFNGLFFRKCPFDSDMYYNWPYDRNVRSSFLNLEAVWSITGPIWRRQFIIDKNLRFLENLKKYQDTVFHAEAVCKTINYKITENRRPDYFVRIEHGDTVTKSNLDLKEVFPVVYDYLRNHLNISSGELHSYRAKMVRAFYPWDDCSDFDSGKLGFNTWDRLKVQLLRIYPKKIPGYFYVQNLLFPERSGSFKKHRFQEKNITLTVSCGRSGTSFLAYQLGMLENSDVYHEPFPRFNNALVAALEDPKRARDFLINEKIPFIYKNHKPHYIETSHFFCQAFFYELLKLDIIPNLILLRRDPIKIARSLYNLGTIPGTDNNYLGLQDHECVFVDSNFETHDFHKCLLYCYEIFARQEKYARIVESKGGRTLQVELEDVKKLSKVRELRKVMGLPGYSLYGFLKSRYRLLFPLTTNRKKDFKTTKDTNLGYDKMNKELIKHLRYEH